MKTPAAAVVVLVLAAALMPGQRRALADTAGDCDGASGTQIMQRAHDRERGDRAVQLWRMTLTNPDGVTRERTVKTLYMYFAGNLQRRIIRFLAPADIRRTTFLNIEVADRVDDQYIFLPAYERTKRIANTERARSFMGTDYTYEDILTRDVAADEHTCIGGEPIGEWRTYHVRSVPRPGSDSQYRAMDHWVDSASDVIVQTRFYGADQDPVKQLSVHRIDRFEQVLVVTDSTMTNLRENHGTRIEVTGVRFDHPEVLEGLFTVQRIDTRELPGIE